MILGPLERMKIIIQTKHMAKYANPVADMPKSIPDLVGSKSNHNHLSFDCRNFIKSGCHKLLQRPIALDPHAYFIARLQVLRFRKTKGTAWLLRALRVQWVATRFQHECCSCFDTHLPAWPMPHKDVLRHDEKDHRQQASHLEERHLWGLDPIYKEEAL